jgi:outer membrane protein OmpA-like peptidoglycan-associated protein
MRSLLLSVCAVSLLAGASFAIAAEPAQTTVTPIAAPSEVTTTPQAVQCVGAEGVVYFDLGAISLSADSQSALSGLAAARNPACTTQFTITGHTDSTGSVRRNRQLAQQRANAVEQKLVTLGVPQDEIVMGGAGESDPQSATEDQLNRRVTVVLAASLRAPIEATPIAPAPDADPS